MKTYFNAFLCDRPFGRAAVPVPALLQWAAESHAALPRIRVELGDYEAVQLEALLSAIETCAADMPDDEAGELAQSIECSPATARLVEERDPTICRWLIGAESHRRWRELLSAAVEAGKLSLIDAVDGLPQVGRETVIQRQDRRLRRLRELGAEFEPSGGGWRSVGKHGALQRLIDEEAARGRPMADKTNVRADLRVARSRCSKSNSGT